MAGARLRARPIHFECGLARLLLALAPVAAAVALAAFAVDAGIAQALAVGPSASAATFIAEAPAVAFARLAAFLFVDAGTAKALAVAVLHLLDGTLRHPCTAHVDARWRRDDAGDAREGQAGG